MKIAENITPEELELIDAFLMEQQTAVQKDAFAERKQSDIEWENKINTIRLLKAGISEAAFKQKIENFHKEVKPVVHRIAPVKRMYNFKKVFFAAASLVFIMLIGFFVFKNNKYEKAYANFYKPDPGLITVMGIADNYNFEEGMVQYKNGKYTNALDLWSEPLKTNPQNDTILYFTASAYQALQQPEKATENYLKVLQQSNSAFYKDASWYLGLIYLENKEKEKAEPLLLQSGREQATDLLQKIN